MHSDFIFFSQTIRTAACVSYLIEKNVDLFLTDSDFLTAAAHALAFDHISVVKILPISVFYPENLNPLPQNFREDFISKNENSCVSQIVKKPKVEGQNIKNDNEVTGSSDGDKMNKEMNLSDDIPEQYNVEEGRGTVSGEKQIIKNETNENKKMEEYNENELKENSANVTLKSAFHIVCQWGSIKCMRYLLDPESTNSKIDDVLHKNDLKCELEKRDHLKNPPNNNNLKKNNVIIDNNIIANKKIDTENSLIKNTEMRLKFPFNTNLSDGTTPLHLAAKYGHISCLTELITAGADFRVFDRYGNTPLSLAQKWGRKECETYLLSLCT